MPWRLEASNGTVLQIALFVALMNGGSKLLSGLQNTPAEALQAHVIDAHFLRWCQCSCSTRAGKLSWAVLVIISQRG